MKTVIFPTDFSKNADRAMLYAVSVATALRARIIAVNAFDLPYSQNVMSTSLLDIMRETSEKGLKTVASKLAKTGIEFETRSLMGNPIRVVKDLTKYYANCMVVLGTKGASGIEEILIGSNAASILHSVNVPVLAIPADAAFKGMKKIVYASDFRSTKDEIALERLGKLACAFKSEVIILHVQTDNDKPATPQRDKFAKHFCDNDFSFHIVSAENKTTEQAILDFANEKDADMVALLAKKHGFLEGLFHSSVTSKVAFHAHRPFLALHEQ
jgi:nucleotide-binding universal stress UspA family protein